MLGARGVGGDEGEVDVGLRGAGQLALGLLRGFPQALHRQLVLGQVNALQGGTAAPSSGHDNDK